MERSSCKHRKIWCGMRADGASASVRNCALKGVEYVLIRELETRETDAVNRRASLARLCMDPSHC